MSDSSSLSSAQSDVEEPPAIVAPVKKTLKLKGGKLTFAAAAVAVSKNVSRKSTPESPSPVREPSPPHDYVLADNPDIAFLVMFRHRFADAFPKTVPNLGPQDVEYGVVDSSPSDSMEQYLCALLGLVLNRQKPVERGHHNRALEEALSTHKPQWPLKWKGVNPLPGKRSFPDMTPEEKIDLLKALCLWSMNASDVIKNMIAVSYKQTRKDDDINQPLSVQQWGVDGRKRRYWLIEGQNDTSFRIYRQSPSKIVNETWWNVAGSLEELKTFAAKLRTTDGSQAARRLADRMESAIPRLEATEEKRKRKEYRLNRKALFTRPEPGFSMYEGRTRGKRMRYTFSDDEDGNGSEDNSTRRSTRHSGRSSPAELTGPTMTSSGRQVRSRFGKSYGDPIPTGADSSRRTRGQANGAARSNRSQTSMDESEEDDEEDIPSGDDWQGDDEDANDIDDDDEDDDMPDIESEDELQPQSLVVKLRYSPKNGSGTADPQPLTKPLPDSTPSKQTLAIQPDNMSIPFVSPNPARIPMDTTAPPLASPFHSKVTTASLAPANGWTPSSETKPTYYRKSSTTSIGSQARPGSSSSNIEGQRQSFKPDPYGAWPPSAINLDMTRQFTPSGQTPRPSTSMSSAPLYNNNHIQKPLSPHRLQYGSSSAAPILMAAYNEAEMKPTRNDTIHPVHHGGHFPIPGPVLPQAGLDQADRTGFHPLQQQPTQHQTPADAPQYG